MDRLCKAGRKIRPFLWLAPSFIFIIGFVYYPFLKNGWLSFHIVNQFRDIKRFAGLENYVRVLQDPEFWQAVRNTLIYALVTVSASMLIAYLLACLARKKRKMSVVYETLFALSMATSDAVMAMIFGLMYSGQLGIINKIFGTYINWLGDAKYALLSLMVIQIWRDIGYSFLFMLASLRNLPEEVMESARMDGVKGLRLHLKVILPLTSPTMFFLLLRNIAHGMTVSSYTMILTHGGPNGATQTLITYIYSKAITSTNFNFAFAATMVGFGISAIMIIISMVMEKRMVHYS